MSAFIYVILCIFIRTSIVSSFKLINPSDIKENLGNVSTVRTEYTSKKVCIIGAGISGLSVARYLKEESINFTIFEATRYVGGTWRYDPRVGTDENGLPLHSSMYKNLRTNSPKPVMELGGFPFPENFPSFPGWKDYYEYIQEYAKHFGLERYVQFLHNVILVRREDNKWKVKHQHVQSKEIFEEEYDYVVVSSGRFSKPKMPNITGENLFEGTIIHSHDYKTPDPYEGRRVLVIGAGPSGMDISIDISKVSKKVIQSHHSELNFTTPYVSHHIMKTDVKEFNKTGAIFVDGTYEELDDVVYCTGYRYNYEFLDETCGLEVSSSSIFPLYNSIVNMIHSSMVFMGLRAFRAIAIDAQARYITALVKGNFTIPTLEEIFRLWRPPRNYHDTLVEESGISPVPPVMFKIMEANTNAYIQNLYTFRDYVYTVLDNHNFTRTLETKLGIVQLSANSTI